jgi:hypothetical protein
MPSIMRSQLPDQSTRSITATSVADVYGEPMTMPSSTQPSLAATDVDRLTRRLLHTSQHNKIPIFLASRIQDDINEMRAAAGLPLFGWGDCVPDEEVERCTVHAEGCSGQHTH